MHLFERSPVRPLPHVPVLVLATLVGSLLLCADAQAQSGKVKDAPDETPVSPEMEDHEERIKYLERELEEQRAFMEDYITKLADMSKSPSIVLCDRGTMDPEAYITRDEFQSILDEEGWSKVVLRDRRYDRVCCLASAANGAEKYYTLDNNVARS